MNYEGLYQCDYRYVKGIPEVFLFLRDSNGIKSVKCIKTFKPYIYIDDSLIKNGFKSDKISKISTEIYKTIFGKDVRKCYMYKPSGAYYIRSHELITRDNVHESDVLFSLRYMIDEVDNTEAAKYKVLTFDIETDCAAGFPDKDNPIEPITCISSHDNYSDKTKTFVWRSDQVLRSDQDIHYFNNEQDMLKAFLSYWNEQDADIITAWNLGFDINYLIARLKYLNILYNRLSSFKDNIDVISGDFSNGVDINAKVKLRPQGEVEILGLVLFDMLKAYRKMHFGELNSYALNNVAVEELGEEKEKVHNTGEVWRKDLSSLISYNRKDVELVYKIDNKCKLISIFDDIKRFSGVRNINDCFFPSRIHETKMMKKYRNLVFPTKPEFKEKSEETMIKGAFVGDPDAGLYENVVCIDAKSLYPSIIYTFNLSTEMVNEEGVEINGVKILQQPKGIMPSMIKELTDLKDEMKEKVKGTGQDISDKMFAIKTFINSFYGINALTSFRLYDKRIAENITYIGRFIINKCNYLINKEYGYKVIYNDTDSVFIEIPKDKNPVEEGKKLQKFLDNNIEKIVHDKFKVHDSTLHMEFEKVYKRLILQRKKRYAGLIIWEDGKSKDEIKIAGMAARRSDTPAISKVVQKKLFNMILRGCTKEQVITYVRSIIDDILGTRLQKEVVALPVKLNKVPDEYKIQNTPKIRGIKWSNKNLGTTFRSGTKFKMIYVIHPETSIVCFDDEEQLKGLKIDWVVMVDKCIFQKIRPIFETLKWDKDYFNLTLYVKNKSTGQQIL